MYFWKITRGNGLFWAGMSGDIRHNLDFHRAERQKNIDA
jgi:hypothetical protein